MAHCVQKKFVTGGIVSARETLKTVLREKPSHHMIVSFVRSAVKQKHVPCIFVSYTSVVETQKLEKSLLCVLFFSQNTPHPDESASMLKNQAAVVRNSRERPSSLMKAIFHLKSVLAAAIGGSWVCSTCSDWSGECC